MHITSRENSKVKAVAQLQKSASARQSAGMLVCEGPTLLAEALQSGLCPLQIFALESAAASLPAGLDCEIHTVSPDVLGKMSDTQTPHGLVFTLPMPPGAAPMGEPLVAGGGPLIAEGEPLVAGGGPLIAEGEPLVAEGEPLVAEGEPLVALDCLRDPGNMGTILRTADALGVRVVLLGSCVDIYSPKVVRAAMGSLFRLTPRRLEYAELAELCQAQGLLLCAATLGSDSLPVGQVALKKACIIIGNESAGVSPQGLAIAQQRVIIPMRGAESLNAAVAAAILMWEAVR